MTIRYTKTARERRAKFAMLRYSPDGKRLGSLVRFTSGADRSRAASASRDCDKAVKAAKSEMARGVVAYLGFPIGN